MRWILRILRLFYHRNLQPKPIDPATENGNAMKNMPLQAFPEQDHEAHVRAHISMLSSQTSQANPQGYIMLQAHVQEHVGMMARDQVTTFFQKSNSRGSN